MLPTLHFTDSAANLPHFQLHTMQWIETHRQADIAQPHKHDYYVIIWVKKGKGRHSIDFQSYPLADNTLWFISPGQPHHLQAEEEPEGYVISFADDFFCISEANRDLLVHTGLFYTFSHRHPCAVLPPQAQVLDRWINEISHELAEPQPMQSDMLLSYLKILLIQLSRFYAQPHPEGTDDARSVNLVRRFMELVERNFARLTQVQAYADLLAVTPNHLNTLVKKYTGSPASDHLKKRRVLEIKRQIYFGEKTAKEIAFSLEFEDEAYFSRFFKTNTGYTFSAYRDQLHQLYR